MSKPMCANPFQRLTPHELVEIVKREAVSSEAEKLSEANMPDFAELERVETVRAKIQSVLSYNAEKLEALFHVSRYSDIRSLAAQYIDPESEGKLPRPFMVDSSGNPAVMLVSMFHDPYAIEPERLMIAVNATRGLVFESKLSSAVKICIGDTSNDFEVPEVRADIARRVLSLVDKRYLSSVAEFARKLSLRIEAAYTQMTGYLHERNMSGSGSTAEVK